MQKLMGFIDSMSRINTPHNASTSANTTPPWTPSQRPPKEGNQPPSPNNRPRNRRHAPRCSKIVKAPKFLQSFYSLVVRPSKLLPQAMVMMPKSASPKKLGFLMASTSVNWNRSSVSRVSVVANRLNFKPVLASQARRSVLARADAEEAAGAIETAEEDGAVSEGAGEETESGKQRLRCLERQGLSLETSWGS